MPTPFAVTGEDVVDLWNEMIERSKIEYDDAEGVPAGAKSPHYPLAFDRRATVNHMLMLVTTIVSTYDARLERFLREKGLI